jgi:Na+-driven multidrug efflux pump
MNIGGALFVSVMTIISSVRSILDVPVLAISEGTSPIISYNYGARKRSHVKKAIKVLMALAFPYTFIVWALIMVFPELFIRIFSSDPTLMGIAPHGMRLYFSAFIFQSFQYCGQTVFKAMGKRKHAIFFSLLRKAVLVVPLTYLLPYVFGLGTDGVFLAEPISNVIGGLACFTTMVFSFRRDPFGKVQEGL